MGWSRSCRLSRRTILGAMSFMPTSPSGNQREPLPARTKSGHRPLKTRHQDLLARCGVRGSSASRQRHQGCDTRRENGHWLLCPRRLQVKNLSGHRGAPSTLRLINGRSLRLLFSRDTPRWARCRHAPEQKRASLRVGLNFSPHMAHGCSGVIARRRTRRLRCAAFVFSRFAFWFASHVMLQASQ